MCRLFGLVSNQPVSIVFSLLRAGNSIYAQSRQHSDGWGIGYYQDHHPVVIKEPVAASASPTFQRAAREIKSTHFVVHIRYRTAGEIDLTNTHPFVQDQWILAQNGGIGGAWHKRIYQEVGAGKIKGYTSGEHLLQWLYSRAGRLEENMQTAEIVQTLQELTGKPQDITSANFVLATGKLLYAFCYAPSGKTGRSLFYLERSKNTSMQSRSTGLSIAFEKSESMPARRVILVASEKLTEENWTSVPNGCLLVVDPEPKINFCQIV